MNTYFPYLKSYFKFYKSLLSFCCKWSKNLSVVMNMTVDLALSLMKKVLSRSSYATDPEANDRTQPLLECVLEEYFTSLLHEGAFVLQVAEDPNILNGGASQNDSSDTILVSENLAWIGQKSADLDNASINEMNEELQPLEYFVLLGCIPNP
ncbi:hypothetical protein R3W88_023044 [Solanum pinnatisectum]|uniref:Uncharacterized protein n=1 Tax=Solanum pinnatisectum TaxID=50273 RepID=A0AAV9LWF1_9SOLN|nr:hypothetical protein R3W88_023044 [Solanum pinnatisectum]